ncbi:MAG: methionyl-tRNA formyltransferase [Candidatus Melainabacteria bacterium]|nr:methionyl-tRNA formyltransferase [Candidatus Melainabacteria bacterium]
MNTAGGTVLPMTMLQLSPLDRPLRLAFIGASGFGLRCVQAAHALPQVQVVGVVTNPPTFKISYRPQGVTNVLHADIQPWAQENQLPVVLMQEKMTDPALIEAIRAWQPDFILVVGWYHMVPKAIRALAPTGGLHASLLPRYSGGAPLVWAIINDEPEAGISFFLFDDGVDSGPILGQRAEPILETDTIATLYKRIESHGIALLEDYLPRLQRGEAVGLGQNESERTMFPQRSPEDGLMDTTWPLRRIYNFVRAQTKPYPGAFLMHGELKLTVWACEQCPASKNPVNQNLIPVLSPLNIFWDPAQQQLLLHTADDLWLWLKELALNGEDMPADKVLPRLQVGGGVF